MILTILFILQTLQNGQDISFSLQYTIYKNKLTKTMNTTICHKLVVLYESGVGEFLPWSMRWRIESMHTVSCCFLHGPSWARQRWEEKIGNGGLVQEVKGTVEFIYLLKKERKKVDFSTLIILIKLILMCQPISNITHDNCV